MLLERAAAPEREGGDAAITRMLLTSHHSPVQLRYGAFSRCTVCMHFCTQVCSNVVIYTPRGRSGGDADVIKQYPVEVMRFPSLAQSAREVEEAYRKRQEATRGQRALEALRASSGRDGDSEGQLLKKAMRSEDDPDADVRH